MVGNEGSFLAPKKLKLPNFGKNANWHQLYFQGFAIRGALVLHLAISGLALGTAGVGSPIWTGAHSHLWSPFNILMPNHLHLFAWPGILNADLDGWVRYWKSQFSNTIGNRSLRWQSSCFHHRLGSCFQPPFYSSGFDLRKAFPIDSGAPAVGTAAAPGP